MSKISGVKKGDIVRIKFVDMKTIIGTKTTTKRGNSVRRIGEWELGSNILAFTYGGDFLVKEDAPEVSKNQILELVNHLDGDTFDVHEEFIDSLQIVDAAAKFVSTDHNLVMVMIENDIFINGDRLENTDDDKHLDNFTNFIERYLVNKAIDSSISKG